MKDGLEKYMSTFAKSDQYIQQLSEIVHNMYTALKTNEYSDRDTLMNKRVT